MLTKAILLLALTSATLCFPLLKKSNWSVPKAPAGSIVDQHGALRAQGNRIVDKDGQQVQLRGMSMFWSQWAGDYWNAGVVNTLVDDWKVQVIRCAMAVNQGGYDEHPDVEKAKLTAVVDAAIAKGVYVIIDWHLELVDPELDKAKPFFDEMSKKYGDHPAVMYETYNEPGPDWGSVKAYHNQIVPVIRANTQNLIICGTTNWSQGVDTAADDPVTGDNIAYTLHFYSGAHKQWLRDKANYAMGKGIAIFVTEWGTGDCSNYDWPEATTWLNWAKDNGISTANWGVYDKDSETCAALHAGADHNGNWTDDNLTEGGLWVRHYIQTGEPGGGPNPPPSGQGCCSWDGGHSCGDTSDYCKESQQHCEGDCNGQWINQFNKFKKFVSRRRRL